VGLSSAFDSAHDGPDELKVPPDFVRRAFQLFTNEPVLISPIVGKEAVYVIALQEIIPRRVQSFEEVREKVVTDYKESKALELAREAGMVFQPAATNALAAKKSFAKICEEAGARHVVLPPFSATTPSLPALEKGLELRRLQSFAFDLPVGGVSQFFPTQEGGFILYVRAVLPLDEAKAKIELPGYIAKVQASRQNDAFNRWFSKQAEGRVVIPQKETPSFAAPRPAGKGR
jgi:parvulin-like peptidyl-prolyl isomerase